jgi:hypothetical protein
MIEAKLVLEPNLSSFSASGVLNLNLITNALANALTNCAITVDGSVLLINNYSRNTILGDFQGHFDFKNIFSGLEADGHVNWYLSESDANGEYLQGRVGLEVCGIILGGGCSGGLFIGDNVPREKVWVLIDRNNHFSVNVNSLPEYITGVYGFGSISFSMDFGIFGGGIEVYAGIGAFLNLPGIGRDVSGLPLPSLLANVGVFLHGEILWGLVSAEAWVNLQMALGNPIYFHGKAGLRGCALWVACHSVRVKVTLDEDGFDISRR